MTYQQTTLAQLQALLATRYESVPFWTSTDATFALNEALRCWNMLTGYWKKRALITTVAGQHWYSVPGTLVYNLRMDWSSYPMDLTSLGDLDDGQSGWEADTAGGTGPTGNPLPTRPALFAPAGLGLFAIWPADAQSGNTLVLDSISETPALVNPGDFVDIGQEELSAILGYALHYLAFKEGGMRFAASLVFYQQFARAAADRNAILNSSIWYRNLIGTDMNREQNPIATSLERPQPQPQEQGA